MNGMILYTTDASVLPKIKQNCRQAGYRELLLRWRNETKEARFLWVQDMTRAAISHCSKRNNCKILLYDQQGYAQIGSDTPGATILSEGAQLKPLLYDAPHNPQSAQRVFLVCKELLRYAGEENTVQPLELYAVEQTRPSYFQDREQKELLRMDGDGITDAFPTAPGLVALDEAMLNRLTGKYKSMGYIILSCGDIEKTRERIKRLGYSYLPVYGKYERKNIEQVYQCALVVFPVNKTLSINGPEYPFSKLKTDIKALLETRPDRKMRIIESESNAGSIKDLLWEYFSNMGITEKDDAEPMAFTGLLLHEPPATIPSAHIRAIAAELVAYGTLAS